MNSAKPPKLIPPGPVETYISNHCGHAPFWRLEKLFGRDQIWNETAIGFIQFSNDREYVMLAKGTRPDELS